MGMAPCGLRSLRRPSQIAVGGKLICTFRFQSSRKPAAALGTRAGRQHRHSQAQGHKPWWSGSADIVSTPSVLRCRCSPRGQAYRAFVLGRAPMIGVGVSKKNMPNYKGMTAKGKKIGVTAPAIHQHGRQL